MIKAKLLAAICAAALFIGCNNKKEKAKETTVPVDTAATTVTEKPAVSTGEVKLLCKSMGEDSLGIPHHDVYLLVDGKETKIKGINGCNDISKTDYTTYEIPAAAVSACGGWWAGAGDYYYVIMEDGKPAVYEGWQDEMQKEKGFHWKKINVQ